MSVRKKSKFSSQIKLDLIKSAIQLRCCREVFFFTVLKRTKQPCVFRIPNLISSRAAKKLFPTLPASTKLDFNNNKLILTENDYQEVKRKFKIRILDSSSFMPRHHCLRAYLKGMFIRSGYLQDPKKAYHLEIIYSSKIHHHVFSLVKKILKVPFRRFKKGKKIVAYIKNQRGIEKFLQKIELFDKVMSLEDIKATKEILSLVNRQVNFETANINKTVAASNRLIEKISKLLAYPNQEIWSPALRELALKRLEFPLDSLEKLGKRLNPPLSKSAVNHRLRRISALYDAVFSNMSTTNNSNQNN